MKSRLASMMTVLLLLLPLGLSPGQQAEIDWKSDIRLLMTELPQKHVDFFNAHDREAFEDRASALIRSVDAGVADHEIIIGLMQLAAMAADGHTGVRPPIEKFHFYPINFRWFDDGIFVVAVDQSHESWIGAELTQIGEMPIQDVLTALKKISAFDNEANFKTFAEKNLNVAEFLNFVGASQGLESVSLEFKQDGKTFRQELRSLPLPEIRAKVRWSTAKIKPPLYQERGRLDFWNDWIAEQKTVFFKYNRCRNASGFNKLVDGTKGFIAQNDVQKFVIDLRNNSGGNSAIFKPLLNYLKANSELNKKGKLFVIVGRQTFSSGLWNALEMKQQTEAVLIGEPTGGRPNHYGEVRTFALPSSKLTVFYSTKRWTLMKDSDPESLEPDVRVQLKAEDYFAGRDPYLQAVFDYRDEK